jgi:hypothetical protein
LSNFGLNASIDLAQAFTSDGALLFSCYGFSGAVCYGKKSIQLVASVDPAQGNLVMMGTVEHLSLHDVGLLVAQLSEDIGLSDQHENIIALLNDTMPSITFDKVQLFIAPQDTVLFDTMYRQGITIKACAHIADADIDCVIVLDQNGFKGSGAVQNFQLGPIMITGYSDSSPALMTIECDLLSGIAAAYIEGGIALDVLDGIQGTAKITFTPTGLSAQCKSMLCGQLEACVTISACGDLTQSANYMIEAQLTNTACVNFVRMLKNAAQSFITLSKDRDFFTAVEQLNDHAVGQMQNIIAFMKSDFIITQASFKSAISDLVQGTMPLVNIQGQHGDRKFTLCMPLNFNDPQACLTSLLEVL